MPDWLELELADRLAPAEAPDALWAAIERGRNKRPAPKRPSRWPVAVIATILVAAGALWMVAKGQEPALDLRRLASMAIAEPPALYSGNPAELEAWLQKQSGVKVPLAPAAQIRLVGASVIRERGARVAVVSFTVRDRPHVVLLARGTAPAHAGVDWAMAGASDHEFACLLCHSSM